jgi:hypothetical protein
LLYYIDYKGNRCGMNGLGKYTHWTHFGNSMTNVCVDSCPGIYEKFTLDTTVTKGYSQSTSDQITCTSIVTNCIVTSTPSSLVSNGFGSCCTFTASPAPSGLYFCVPAAVSAGSANMAKQYIEDSGNMMNAAFGDVLTGWYILLIAVVVAFAVAFIWLNLLRWCAGCFVWSAIFLSILMFAILTAASYFMWDTYKNDGDASNDDMENIALGCLIIFGIVTAVMVCLVVCLCKQISIAVGIIKEACKAVNAMKETVLFPIVQYLILLVFLIFWIIGALYMASTGELKQDATTGVYTFVYTDDMKKAMAYYFFGLLWNMAFIDHMTALILSGAFGAWYWTPCEEKLKGNLPSFPVMASVKRSIFYHTGTVAFGSFIIAVIQFIRYCLAYIKEKYLKDKPTLACLVSIIECCLKCFERCMEFISRNAYIVTACKGKNFCMAAYDAFCFILANIGQIAAVNWVSAYLMFLGKAFVCAGTAAVCWFIIAADSDLANPLVLVILCLLIGFVIASVFLGVFENAISTILVCFCWEKDAKGNFSNGQVYATDDLNKFIEGAAAAKQALDEKASAPDGVTEVQPTGAEKPLQGTAEKTPAS